MLVVNKQLKIPLRELRFSFARSSGPGGQNVNKVNTKATLRWSVRQTPSLPEDVRERFVVRFRRRIAADGDVIVTSQRYRDQGRNVADCLAKLRDMIEMVAAAPKVRRATKPTKSSRLRMRKDKESRSQKKQLRKPPRRDD